MSKYIWPVGDQNEGNIAGSRLSSEINARLGLATYSYDAAKDAAMAELLATTPEVFNVKSFGARGDGVADDTEALRAALSAVASGGILYFPAGTYKITSALAITAGVTIRGATSVDDHYGGGPGTYVAAFIYQATASTPVFTIGSKVWNVEVSDLAISGVAPVSVGAGAQAGKYAFKMEDLAANGSSYRMTFRNLMFHDLDRGFHVADAAYEAVSGTPTDWQCDNVLVEHCTFFNVNRAFHFNTINADSWTVAHCTFNIPTNGFAVYWRRIGVFKTLNSYAVPAAGATGTEFFRLAGYNSAIINIDTCTGSDGLAYFLHVDGSAYTGDFDNITQIMRIDSCQIEAPLLVEKQRRIVSVGSMYADDNPECSGPDVRVDSYSDTFIAPATGWNMSGLRPDLRLTPAKANNGTATVANATTSIAVTHGLGVTPDLQDVSVTPTNNLGTATKFWISSPTATQFTINVDADPGGSTATFVWTATIQ